MQSEAYQLYWLDGEHEVVHGETIEDAMSLAGYGPKSERGRELDFYHSGDTLKYYWRPTASRWSRMEG